MKTRIVKKYNTKYNPKGLDYCHLPRGYQYAAKYYAQVKYKYWPFWVDIDYEYTLERAKEDIDKFLRGYNIIKEVIIYP